jgi:hypothetical protein
MSAQRYASKVRAAFGPRGTATAQSPLVALPHIKQEMAERLRQFFDVRTIQDLLDVMADMDLELFEVGFKVALANPRARQCIDDTTRDGRRTGKRVVVHDYNWPAYHVMVALARAAFRGIRRGNQQTLPRVQFQHIRRARDIRYPARGDTPMCASISSSQVCLHSGGRWINGRCQARRRYTDQWDGFQTPPFDDIVPRAPFGTQRGIRRLSGRVFRQRFGAKRRRRRASSSSSRGRRRRRRRRSRSR